MTDEAFLKALDHAGQAIDRTGGAPVRNVAWPVIDRPYTLLEFAPPGARPDDGPGRGSPDLGRAPGLVR